MRCFGNRVLKVVPIATMAVLLAVVVMAGCARSRTVMVPDPQAPLVAVPSGVPLVLIAWEAESSVADQWVRWMAAESEARGIPWIDARSVTAGPSPAVTLRGELVSWSRDGEPVLVLADYWTSGGGPGRRVSESVRGRRFSAEVNLWLVDGSGAQYERSIRVQRVAVDLHGPSQGPSHGPPRGTKLTCPAYPDAVVVTADRRDFDMVVARDVVALVLDAVAPRAESISVEVAAHGDLESQQLMLAKDYRAAEVRLRMLVATESARLGADCFNLGLVLEAQGLHAEALAWYSKAVELEPQQLAWAKILDAAAQRSSAAASMLSDPIDQAL